MRLLLVILCFFSLLSVHVTGQVKFKKGFIVLDQNLVFDTIHGLISYKEYTGFPKSPGILRFKKDEFSMTKIYKVADLKYFEIENSDIYSKVETFISDPVCECGVRQELPSVKTGWMKAVIVGPSLSVYILDERLYAKDSDDVVTDIGTYYDIGAKYRYKLFQLANEYNFKDELMKDILRCHDFTDLTRIMFIMNNGNIKVYPLTQRRVKISLFAGAGLGVGNMDVYRTSNYPDVPFVNKKLQSLSIGTDISATFTSFFLRFNLAYATASFKGKSRLQNGTLYLDEYSFSQKNITPSISILNNFWDNGIFSFYGGVALNQNFSFYKKDFTHIKGNSSGYEFPVYMPKSWFGVGLSAGAMLNHQWEAAIQMEGFNKFTSNDSDIFFTSKAYIFSIRYHLKESSHKLAKDRWLK